MSETPASDSLIVPLIAKYRDLYDHASIQDETALLTKIVYGLMLAILTLFQALLATPIPEPKTKSTAPQSATATRAPSNPNPTIKPAPRRRAAPAQPPAAPIASPPPRANRGTKFPTQPQTATKRPTYRQRAQTPPPHPALSQIRRSNPIAFARPNRCDFATNKAKK